MARFNHRNVLSIVGVCTVGEPVMLLTQVGVLLWLLWLGATDSNMPYYLSWFPRPVL